MSIVVAVRRENKIIVGYDTLSTWGGRQMTADKVVETKKVTVAGNGLIAVTGWSLYHNILEDFISKKKNQNLDLTDRRSIFKFYLSLYKDLKDKYSFVHHGDEEEAFSDLDSSFMVVSEGGIFQICSNMSVTEYSQYCAIGSGADFAYGALKILYDREKDIKEICRQALLTACEFDIYCREPLGYFEVEAKKRRNRKNTGPFIEQEF